jgi:DNA-binding NarL/FixJ family response regulator
MALLRTLTSRERLILKLLAEGVAVRDIGGRLDVSQHTVRTHMQNLYAKLGAHSRLDVVRFAAEHGLVGGEGERAAHES